MNTIQTRSDEGSDELSALDVLLDGDIDKVMSQLDKVVAAAPSYRKLISRWENQGWSSRPPICARKSRVGRFSQIKYSPSPSL